MVVSALFVFKWTISFGGYFVSVRMNKEYRGINEQCGLTEDHDHDDILLT